MRKALVALLLGVFLAGASCAEDASPKAVTISTPKARYFQVVLPDDRIVSCVLYQRSIDCEWPAR